MKTYPNTYFETFASDGEKCSVFAFDTLEEAIEHAEKNGCQTIQEYGGCYTEYEKCEFCGEWFDVAEMNIENYCERCQIAIQDHGFAIDPRKKRILY